MANAIIKWCKTKLMNGYKHINVEAGGEFGGCRSDTETLMRGSEEEFVLGTPIPTTPSVGVGRGGGRPPRGIYGKNVWKGNLATTEYNHNVHSQSRQRARNTAAYVEEVTCDVSLSAGNVDKQEFAFTLYDFDGHGKITKDDITGLVQTIYEAVGSSLSLPPCGSRTIRVKLTVAPEVTPNAPPMMRRTEGILKDSPRSLQEPPSSPLYSPRGLDEVEVASTPGRSPRDDGDLEDLNHSRRMRRRRGRRKTSLHRQELLQIIQANMEKNNLFYPPFHHRHYPPHHHLHHNHRRRRRHHCGCHCGTTPVHPSADPKPQFLSCKDSNDNCGCQRVCHYRSRSHDLTTDSPHVFRHHLLDNTSQPLPPSNTPDRPTSPKSIHHHHHNHLHPEITYHHRSRSCGSSDGERKDCPGKASSTINLGAAIKGVCEGGSSPPDGKHKHRQEEHARAMSQVVTWLQRSTFQDCNKGEKLNALKIVDGAPATAVPATVRFGPNIHIYTYPANTGNSDRIRPTNGKISALGWPSFNQS